MAEGMVNRARRCFRELGYPVGVRREAFDNAQASERCVGLVTVTGC